jgi:hypothetical protein
MTRGLSLGRRLRRRHEAATKLLVLPELLHEACGRIEARELVLRVARMRSPRQAEAQCEDRRSPDDHQRLRAPRAYAARRVEQCAAAGHGPSHAPNLTSIT